VAAQENTHRKRLDRGVNVAEREQRQH
jgi:hypothetical protein